MMKHIVRFAGLLFAFAVVLLSVPILMTGCCSEKQSALKDTGSEVSTESIQELEKALRQVDDYATSLTQSVEHAKLVLSNIKEKLMISQAEKTLKKSISSASKDSKVSCRTKGRSWLAFTTLLAFIAFIGIYVYRVRRKALKPATSENSDNTAS